MNWSTQPEHQCIDAQHPKLWLGTLWNPALQIFALQDGWRFLEYHLEPITRMGLLHMIPQPIGTSKDITLMCKSSPPTGSTCVVHCSHYAAQNVLRADPGEIDNGSHAWNCHVQVSAMARMQCSA